jgi:FlaA1/EpsC-like NDP-sugar epimerase
MRPRRLVIVDRAESALYTIQRELETRRSPYEATEVSTYLANVVSRAAMDRIVGSTRPDVIFHAAACKHVPMMESHTSEALQVNVGGTLAVVEAAVAADTSTFVLVSTDKAVDPTSTMGATKRLAEWIVADAARRTERAYVSVRFGNVLGSNGSVIPIFQEQLEAGLPLTITDREMTRYFMTIPEASSLIIAASSLGSAGDLFVLDMGEPIRILDLARDFVRLAGRDPETVPIVFTGTRPGEKLHETLFYDHESTKATAHPKVLLARGSMPPEDIRAAIEGLLRLADGEHEEVARRELFAMIHGRMEVLAKPAPQAKVEPAVAPRPIPDAPAAAAASNA